MDDYEALKEAGSEITALDTLVYVKSKSAAGYELDRSDMSDLGLASGYVIDDATNGIRENLEANIRTNSRDEVLASLSVLDRFDSEDASLARGYLAGVREEERSQQLIQDNQYLADFKELDRAKTDDYLASQSFENQHPIAASFLNDPVDTVAKVNKEIWEYNDQYYSQKFLESNDPLSASFYGATALVSKTANFISPSDGNELAEMAITGNALNEPAQLAGKSLGYLWDSSSNIAKGVISKASDEVDNAALLQRYGGDSSFKFDLQLFAEKSADDAATGASKKYYRYLDEGEANVIRNTGEIPNTNKYGDPKDIFITDRRYETAGGAKTYNQLPTKPEYRIEIDPENVTNRTPFTKVEPTHHPEWGKGGGVEAITKDPIPVNPDDLVRLKGAGK